MTITATEFKMNFGKYLDLVNSEDILITKNGKTIAQLSLPQADKLFALDQLIGFVKCDGDISLDDIRSERLSRQ